MNLAQPPEDDGECEQMDNEARLLALQAHYLAAIEVVLDQLAHLGIIPDDQED